MAYQKTTWTDRTVERPLTFIMQNNGDGTVTLIPSEGSIITPGTPITADKLNNLEQGVANAFDSTVGGLVNGHIQSVGDVHVGGNLQLGAAGKDIIFSASGRAKKSRIYWNASNVANYGLNFVIDDVNAFRMWENGEFENPNGKLELKANGDVTIRPRNGGIFRLFASDGTWLNFTGDGFIQNPSGTGNVTLSTGDGGGYAHLRAKNGVRLMSGSSSEGIRCANLAYNGYVPVFASGFNNMSARELKKNISSFKKEALSIIEKTPIRTFQYKDEKETDNQRVGLVYDEAPQEVKNLGSEGIDLYAMVSVGWKAIQELTKQLDNLTHLTTTLQEKVSILETKLMEVGNEG